MVAPLTLNDARALFARRRDAWLAEDLDAYLDCFADELEFRSPSHREPLCGRAAYAELVRRSARFAKPVAFDFHQLAVEGDTVFAYWTIRMVRRDQDTPVTWDGLSVCEIRDGRITRWREMWDPSPV